MFRAAQASAGLPFLSRLERDDADPFGHWHDSQIEPSGRAVGKQELHLGPLPRALLHAAFEHGEERLQLQPGIALHDRATEQPFAGKPCLANHRVIQVQVLPVEPDDLAALLQSVQYVPRNLVERLHSPPLVSMAGEKRCGKARERRKSAAGHSGSPLHARENTGVDWYRAHPTSALSQSALV